MGLTTSKPAFEYTNFEAKSNPKGEMTSEVLVCAVSIQELKSNLVWPSTLKKQPTCGFRIFISIY